MISAPVPTSWPSGRTYIWSGSSRLAAAAVVYEINARPVATPVGRSATHASSGVLVPPTTNGCLVNQTCLPGNVANVVPVVNWRIMHTTARVVLHGELESQRVHDVGPAIELPSSTLSALVSAQLLQLSPLSVPSGSVPVNVCTSPRSVPVSAKRIGLRIPAASRLVLLTAK